MGTFRELVEMVLVGFLQEEPEKAEGLDPALVERVRTGEATLADLDLDRNPLLTWEEPS